MSVFDIRPIIAVSAPLFACALIMLFGKRQNIREAISICFAIISAVSVYSMAGGVLSGTEYEFELCKLTDGIGLLLRADSAGMIFACVSSFLYIVVLFYAIGYMRGHNEQNQTGFYAFFAICICSAIGTAFAANMLTFFMFFEMLTIATWPLVFHARTDEAKFAGRKYLIYTLIPGQLMLVGIVITYEISGSIDFVSGGFLDETMASAPALCGLYFLLCIAGCVKTGVMPFHGWLPSAMVAPTPVSALLHAVAVVKAGAFCIVRMTCFVFGPDLFANLRARDVLMWFAAGTIICASLIAIRQDNFKKRLAFSTIGQLSYIILGICFIDVQGITGSLFYIVAHALMKITLFMVAGAVLVTAHKNNISDMRGIGHMMPVSFICYTVCAFGIIGLPFIVGFVGKLNLGLGSIGAGKPFFFIVILISSVFGTLYLLPVSFVAFFAKNENDEFEKRHEASPFMLVPICVTATLSVVIGIMPDFGPKLYSLARMAAETIMK